MSTARHGGYGPPAGTGGSRGNKILIVVILAVLVLGAVGVTTFALTRSNDGNPSAASTTPSGTATSDGTDPTDSGTAGSVDPATDDPTGTDAPVDGPTVVDSKAIATKYFADVNAKNKTDALSLVCDEGKADFQKDMDASDSLFGYTLTNIAYAQAGGVGDDITALGYTVSATDAKGAAQTMRLILYFVDENGVRLCGEEEV